MTNGVKLTDIAKSIKMSPKRARSRMRRVDIPRGALISKAGHWVFAAKRRAWVLAQLKGDRRFKAAA